MWEDSRYLQAVSGRLKLPNMTLSHELLILIIILLNFVSGDVVARMSVDEFDIFF